MYPRRVTDTVGDSVLFLVPPQTRCWEPGLLTADGEERVISWSFGEGQAAFLPRGSISSCNSLVGHHSFADEDSTGHIIPRDRVPQRQQSRVLSSKAGPWQSASDPGTSTFVTDGLKLWSPRWSVCLWALCSTRKPPLGSLYTYRGTPP